MTTNISSQTSSADLLTSLRKNLDFWSNLLKSALEKLGEEKKESEEYQEYKALSDFIDGPLTSRLMGVYQEDNELKDRYMKALEPFYTQEGMQAFIEHHFDVELDPVEDLLIYRKKEPFEKEVGTLFMLFKIKKTIDTINTLQKSVDSDDPFPSYFSKENQQDYLSVLREILKLFFIKFVKKEYVKSVFERLSEKQFNATGLGKRREKGITYIRDKTLAGKEVREYFILLFFTKEMRTIRKGKIINIAFNYLDFELMKNEYLVDWLQRKLKGNKQKDLIYQKYKINNRTIKELVDEKPERESVVLQQIPLETFNDIAEQVNEIVEEKDKTPVPTMSKNHGEMARSENLFGKAKKLAKMSLTKMTKLLATKKAKKAPPKSDFTAEVIVDNDIEFAYFDDKPNTYQNKLEYLKKKMGDKQHESFRNTLWTFFEHVSTDHLIKRDQPVKEWAIPFFLKNGMDCRLLIVGAEISQKTTESGLQTGNYEFNPYFVYGLSQKNDEYGQLLGSRKARATEFFCYSYAEDKVQKEALQFFEYITLQRENQVFQFSDIRFKAKKDRVKTEELIKAEE